MWISKEKLATTSRKDYTGRPVKMVCIVWRIERNRMFEARIVGRGECGWGDTFKGSKRRKGGTTYVDWRRIHENAIVLEENTSRFNSIQFDFDTHLRMILFCFAVNSSFLWHCSTTSKSNLIACSELRWNLLDRILTKLLSWWQFKISSTEMWVVTILM